MAEAAELFPLSFDSGGEVSDDENAVPPYPSPSSSSASTSDSEIRWHPGGRFDHRFLDPGIFVSVFSPPGPPSSSSSSSSPRAGRGVPSDSDSNHNDPDDEVDSRLHLFDGGSARRGGGMEIDPFHDPIGLVRFAVSDGVEEMGSGRLGREVGRGFGFGPEKLQENEGGFAGMGLKEEGPEWGEDGFFAGRRSVALDSGGGSGQTPFRSRDGGGLNVVGFISDSDSDSDAEREDSALTSHSDGLDVPDEMAENLGLPLCWDCLRIEEYRSDLMEGFDWEEIDRRVDEREDLSTVMDADKDRSVVQEEANAGLEIEVEEWEVLLAMNDLERNASVEREDAESYLGEEHEDFVYTSEYNDVLVGQFADHESSIKGNPPAAQSVVEHLPSVVLTKVDVANNNTLCAVCKEEMLMVEKVKQLPCLHHYHTECILPWLRIRNTCPVCRYELPTEDPDYENWRALRARSGSAVQESRFRYNLEFFYEEWGT